MGMMPVEYKTYQLINVHEVITCNDATSTSSSCPISLVPSTSGHCTRTLLAPEGRH